jgi:hypothetical protein
MRFFIDVVLFRLFFQRYGKSTRGSGIVARASPTVYPNFVNLLIFAMVNEMVE